MEKVDKNDSSANKTYTATVLREMRDYFMDQFDHNKDGVIGMDEFVGVTDHNQGHSKGEWVPNEDKILEEAARQYQEAEARELAARTAQQQQAGRNVVPQMSNVGTHPDMPANAPVIQPLPPSDQVPVMSVLGSPQTQTGQFNAPPVPSGQPSAHPEQTGQQPGNLAGAPVTQTGTFHAPQGQPVPPGMQQGLAQNTGFQANNPIPQAPPVQPGTQQGFHSDQTRQQPGIQAGNQVPQAGSFGTPQAPNINQDVHPDQTGQRSFQAGQAPQTGNFGSVPNQSGQLPQVNPSQPNLQPVVQINPTGQQPAPAGFAPGQGNAGAPQVPLNQAGASAGGQWTQPASPQIVPAGSSSGNPVPVSA
ncbi:unnamed protein product [Echinostoma caproni]|uniref:EF-hand domain-containing protein n=1 Tax=Echinostoma caproni TaxID=27848 RepID=A0A183AXW2_9TREM|nr:unnamed protein product [Echinostoma caproni]